jgi:hypothetical protein
MNQRDTITIFFGLILMTAVSFLGLLAALVIAIGK